MPKPSAIGRAATAPRRPSRCHCCIASEAWNYPKPRTDSREEPKDLPTLKVLGWDSLDTALHVDEVVRALREGLSWPEDVDDVDEWRQRWSSAFTVRHREVVTTSKALAIRLAALARAIRDRIHAVMAIETDKGPLTTLMRAFQEALVHDLDADGFADMYAQTIAYGLLSARVTNPASNTADGFSAQLPVTNPFLKELMQTFLQVGGRRKAGVGIDFDELGVNEVVELLDAANMDAVLIDFGDRNPQEDPVIHFYELFLKEYDAKKRMQRGVFYTPRPVVSFIVRSVHDLLQTEFGLDDGLADTATWGDVAKNHSDLMLPNGVKPADRFVTILDPATGTGTFLVEVIDVIHKTLVQKWESENRTEQQIVDLWNEYVPQHLLPRAHGYELLMAPYAIAHLKIGLKLHETGYRFDNPQRVRVFLTNALEPAHDFSGQLDFTIPALAHEADAVNKVKSDERFTVIIGNPPYSDSSQNLGPQFAYLIDRFRHYAGERIHERGAIRFEHAINNDYVKFWGLAIHLVDRVPIATVQLITSNSFLEGKSFRGVREALIEASSEIAICDLHGEGWAGRLAAAGIEDQNVFEIQTGVAITQLQKQEQISPTPTVSYADLTGSYRDKSSRLSRSEVGIPSQVGLDRRQYLSFVPALDEQHDEYWDFPQVDTFFLSSVDGIKTSRDGLVIANTQAECEVRVLRFSRAVKDSISDIADEFRFKPGKFDVRAAQRHLAATFDKARIRRIGYRPMDVRYIYYDRELILSHRMNLMPSILHPESWGLVFASRLSSKGFDHVVATDTLCTNKFASHDINSRMFPVICLDDVGFGKQQLRSNVKRDVLDRACIAKDLDELSRATSFGCYIYAVTNSPSYRERYANEISQDFPRVPLAGSPGLAASLAELGAELRDLHCLRSAPPKGKFPFEGQLGDEIRSPRWKEDAIWINESSAFLNVAAEVWQFRMAGYAICKTWFSAGGKVGLQRIGQRMTAEAVDDFSRVLWAIDETLRVRRLLDEVIEQCGGWPNAFASPKDAE